MSDEQMKHFYATHPLSPSPDMEGDLADALGEIERRLEALEQQLSEQGINDLAVAIERRIVSRMRYGRNPQIERAK